MVEQKSVGVDDCSHEPVSWLQTVPAGQTMSAQASPVGEPKGSHESACSLQMVPAGQRTRAQKSVVAEAGSQASIASLQSVPEGHKTLRRKSGRLPGVTPDGTSGLMGGQKERSREDRKSGEFFVDSKKDATTLSPSAPYGRVLHLPLPPDLIGH
jgi:hypothetical protein